MLRSLCFKKQAGISLLEVMLSLSIIAIILVMATRYFFVASGNSNVNKLRGQIGTVVSALQEYRNQNAKYTGVTTGTLINAGFIARTNDVSGTAPNETLSNPWNSDITITPAADGNSATIVTSLPSSTECSAVAAGYATDNGECVAGSNGNNVLNITVGTPASS